MTPILVAPPLCHIMILLLHFPTNTRTHTHTHTQGLDVAVLFSLSSFHLLLNLKLFLSCLLVAFNYVGCCIFFVLLLPLYDFFSANIRAVLLTAKSTTTHTQTHPSFTTGYPRRKGKVLQRSFAGLHDKGRRKGGEVWLVGCLKRGERVLCHSYHNAPTYTQ